MTARTEAMRAAIWALTQQVEAQEREDADAPPDPDEGWWADRRTIHLWGSSFYYCDEGWGKTCHDEARGDCLSLADAALLVEKMRQAAAPVDAEERNYCGTDAAILEHANGCGTPDGICLHLAHTPAPASATGRCSHPLAEKPVVCDSHWIIPHDGPCQPASRPAEASGGGERWTLHNPTTRNLHSLNDCDEHCKGSVDLLTVVPLSALSAALKLIGEAQTERDAARASHSRGAFGDNDCTHSCCCCSAIAAEAQLAALASPQDAGTSEEKGK